MPCWREIAQVVSRPFTFIYLKTHKPQPTETGNHEQ